MLWRLRGPRTWRSPGRPPSVGCAGGLPRWCSGSHFTTRLQSFLQAKRRVCASPSQVCASPSSSDTASRRTISYYTCTAHYTLCAPHMTHNVTLHTTHSAPTPFVLLVLSGKLARNFRQKNMCTQLTQKKKCTRITPKKKCGRFFSRTPPSCSSAHSKDPRQGSKDPGVQGAKNLAKDPRTQGSRDRRIQGSKDSRNVFTAHSHSF